MAHSSPDEGNPYGRGNAMEIKRNDVKKPYGRRYEMDIERNDVK